MPQQIEIRPVCPKCGCERYVRDGQVERVVYRKCLAPECGHRGTVLRFTNDEVSELRMLKGDAVGLSVE